MSLLPDAFAALEPYAEKWAIDGAARRAALRSQTSDAERRAFYGAVLPLAATALDALDARPLAEHDAREKRLMSLLLSFAHAALAVEMVGEGEAAHAPLRDQLKITRAPSDF